MNEDRLFPFLTPQRFDGGWVGDHSQVLINRGDDENLFLWFDGAGNFLRLEGEPFPIGPLEEYDLFRRRYDEAIRSWMEERGVVPGMLRVRQFWLDEPFTIGIARHPEWMLEFLADPYAEAPDDWDRERERIDRWEHHEGFIFWWDQSEYWMNETGKVVAT